VGIAIEAIQSATHPHCFLGHTKHGQSAIFVTTGNPDCHVILRGGRKAPNYTADSIDQVCTQLQKAKLAPRVMVDCSHANSNKDYTKQLFVSRDVIKQIADGEQRIMGVMIESNLVGGAQKLDTGQPLTYGQSITDGCVAWEETREVLGELAGSVRLARR
jgi:3-deoxy-7-phosphoheptulonate synthase